MQIKKSHDFYFLPMSHLPGGRKSHVYNAQERAAIDPFKADYLAATSAAARKIIAQNDIFPALWNHWVSIGQVLDDGETRLRTEVFLLYYIAVLPRAFFFSNFFIGFIMFGGCRRRFH
jgi:hypothetical protein